MTQALEAQAYTELLQLYAEYTAAIDAGDWDRWPEFFRSWSRFSCVQ